jgi:hypothetical protein
MRKNMACPGAGGLGPGKIFLKQLKNNSETLNNNKNIMGVLKR